MNLWSVIPAPYLLYTLEELDCLSSSREDFQRFLDAPFSP